MTTTPRFPTGCGKTAFDALLTEIKEITNGEEEDLKAEFNECTKIRKHENPKRVEERLEHTAESLDRHHGGHKTDSEIMISFCSQMNRTRNWLTQQSSLKGKGREEQT